MNRKIEGKLGMNIYYKKEVVILSHDFEEYYVQSHNLKHVELIQGMPYYFLKISSTLFYKQLWPSPILGLDTSAEQLSKTETHSCTAICILAMQAEG